MSALPVRIHVPHVPVQLCAQRVKQWRELHTTFQEGSAFTHVLVPCLLIAGLVTVWLVRLRVRRVRLTPTIACRVTIVNI